MNSSNALDPQSPQARAIYDLGIVSSIVFLLIFVVVAGAIVYAILRFRARAGEADPKQIAGNRKVETAWTIIPFLIVIFLFVITLKAMNRADPPPVGPVAGACDPVRDRDVRGGAPDGRRDPRGHPHR